MPTFRTLWERFWDIELYRFPWGNGGRGTPVKLAPVVLFGVFVAGILIYHYGFVV
jgi:hypothetical protein